MPSEDPKDLTPLQQLLRLKRHETPGSAFVEQFVSSFHLRQRSELLKHSARSLLWERWTTYWGAGRPATQWAMVGAAAAIALGFAWKLTQDSATKSEKVASKQQVEQLGSSTTEEFPVDAIMIMGLEPENESTESQLLLSRHFSGGYSDDARQVRAAKRVLSHLESEAEKAEQP